MHIDRPTQTGGQPNRGAHKAVVTTTHMHDKHPIPDLLHGKEQTYVRRQHLRQPEGVDQQPGGQGQIGTKTRPTRSKNYSVKLKRLGSTCGHPGCLL
jgi:hypothetical protein